MTGSDSPDVELSKPGPAPSPVRIRGDLDPAVSRWMWLVKWILAIPHYIVLFFLGIGYVVVWIIALLAILFTGVYPRALFDFTVGVLRWSWRVAFYAWSPLGTDKYPPFSLNGDDDYPADLEVDYPAELSRGLVLVKWWLLAIPHYLVVMAFAGGGYMAFSDDYGMSWLALQSILTLIAVIALLVTATYPARLFDFLLGLHRWSLRVQVYASLLRDEYPPFRLDQGPREPGSL
ncbi:DUF4389 domain-containing protein [Nocardia sp. NPDC127579]|uniref:DUF4389 domain-containing protein n=1 Tax=Nocardia sp. NPDC127579 TaxID=3345402 RepID=UPI0036252F71